MMLNARPTIVLFGDSITQLGFSIGESPGWVGLLANAYSRRADILSRGYSGYNTRHALDILPTIFGSSPGEDEDGKKSTAASSLPSQPLFVSIFFGANDASLPGNREHNQHVPIDEYENNLRQIVSSIRSSRMMIDSTTPIIMMTPPPVDKSAWDKYCMEKFDELSPRTNDVSKLYGDRVKAVAQDMDCSIVDSFSLLQGNESEEQYGLNLEDGLHLNSAGNKRLYEGFMDVIQRELPHLAPSIEEGDGDVGVKLDGALWKDLC